MARRGSGGTPITYETVATWPPSKINKALDRLARLSSELTDEFIAAGRGYETPSETWKLDDPLARRAKKIFDEKSVLRHEIERSYGPGAPSRLPKGFGPII